MMNLWTRDEIENILLQMEAMRYPFNGYTLCRLEGRLKLLGQGGSALVYEMTSSADREAVYALKVIGFGDKNIDTVQFLHSTYAQKKLGESCGNIVKVYDYAIVHVWLDENIQVLRLENTSDLERRTDCLKLHFIRMEALEPVLVKRRTGAMKLYPADLEHSELETMHLAHNIGNALAVAHAKGFLHRDVKLENVFFSPQTGQYKLGDFGIARATYHGLASTTAYTQGYGAPEVVKALDEKYYNTADIYSLGMMIYVLLNELKFPESDSYSANFHAQYTKGFQLSKPSGGSYDMLRILKKMCSYEPHARYQSVTEVQKDLEKLIFSDQLCYKRECRKASLVLGNFFLGLGVVQLLLKESALWMIVTSFIFAVVLYVQFLILHMGSWKLIYYWYKRNRYWRYVGKISFICVILGGTLLKDKLPFELMKVGLAGMGLRLYWGIREWGLINRDIHEETLQTMCGGWIEAIKAGIFWSVVKIKLLDCVVRMLQKDR